MPFFCDLRNTTLPSQVGRLSLPLSQPQSQQQTNYHNCGKVSQRNQPNLHRRSNTFDWNILCHLEWLKLPGCVGLGCNRDNNAMRGTVKELLLPRQFSVTVWRTLISKRHPIIFELGGCYLQHNICNGLVGFGITEADLQFGRLTHPCTLVTR